MKIYKNRFFEGLERLGVKNDDTLLVHSSFKSLGQSMFSAQELLSFFIEYLNKGSLLLPSLSHKYVTSTNPCFDMRKTRSCVGYLPETFRLNFDVVRSVHPTHSVCAIGKEAISITKSHSLDNTPCGANSPFALLPEYNGKILMLGCGLNPNTSMHAIEETVEPSYLLGDPLEYSIINNDGSCYNKKYRTHNFKGFAQRYDNISSSNEDDWIKETKIFEAACSIMNAKKLWTEAKRMLLKNSYSFVEKIDANTVTNR